MLMRKIVLVSFLLSQEIGQKKDVSRMTHCCPVGHKTH